ncbi:hypothetical protein PWT90_01499 [Aphanocladium album]|nr:hypothetical protein PWT90_01499 [Aphanocladium album]
MSTSCSISLDDRWGPVVASCRRRFDFTLLFEQATLAILPASCFFFLAILRILQLRTQDTKARLNIACLCKLVLAGGACALQLALIGLWAQDEDATRVAVASSTVSAVSLLSLALVSFFEHTRTIRSSFLIGWYLLLTILLDTAQTRTLWLMEADKPISALFTAYLVAKILLLILEMVPKNLISKEDLAKSPEDRCNFVSRSFFLWLLPLMQRGFRHHLRLEDLFPPPKEAEPRSLENKLSNLWDQGSIQQKYRLIVATAKAISGRLLAPILPRLFISLFTILQPVLLRLFIKFLDEKSSSPDAGYGLFGAYAIVYIGFAVSNAWYYHQVIKCIAITRAALISLLYNKSLNISIGSDKSASVTMMSTDIERIAMGMRSIHDIWASAIEVGISAWLLEAEVGVAVILPIVIPVLCTFGAAMVSGRAGKKQEEWMGKIESRLQVTTQSLSSVKELRLSGFTRIAMNMIQSLRDSELASAAKYRWLEIAAMVMGFTPMMISPVLTFAVYIAVARSHHAPLDVTKMFVSLSYLTLIARPLSVLLQAAPQMASMVACFTRIQEFLQREDNVQPQTGSPEKSSPVVEDREKNNHWEFKAQNIAWPSEKVENEKSVLQNLHIKFPRGKTTMIIGPVGCGKTTLVNGLLGEVDVINGTGQLPKGSIAYCDQTSWIINGTLKQNIVMFSPTDEIRYSAVIDACALRSDLAQLPAGDQSNVGSTGITLSGGQKQRICLARALFSQKAFNVFDDILSGLDATTESSILQKVFGPAGLLGNGGTATTIIATHSVRLAPLVDHIICLGQDGQVTQQGSFAELSVQQGYFKSLGVEFAKDLTASTSSSTIDSGTTTPTQIEEALPVHENAAKVPNSVGSDEPKQPGKPSGVYRYYIRAIGRGMALLYVILAITYAFLFTFPYIWAKWWTSANAQGSGHGDSYYIGIYALLQVMCLTILVIFAHHAVITIINSSGSRLHQSILSTTFFAPLSFFSATDSGVTLNRFSQDLQLVDNELPMAALDMACSGLIMVGQLLLIINTSYWLALTFPAIFLALYVVQRVYLQTSRQMRHLDLELKSPLYSIFTETTQGLASIRSFGWQTSFKDLFYSRLNNSQRPFYLMFCIQKWLALVLECITAGFVLLLVGLVIALRDSVDVGFLGVAMSNIIMLSGAMANTVEVSTQLETSIAAVQRIRDFEKDTPSEVKNTTQHAVADQPWPSNGEIALQNVTASYESDSDKPVLKNLTMQIAAGQKIGICGRTGSGKSSLMLSLFRMTCIEHGTITIDGQDTSTVDLELLRNGFAAVPQDPFFLEGSVRFNADPYEERSDSEIEQALASVQLADVIREKGGLDTKMSDMDLSKGSKQLFCLARAVLKQSKIVVLDEATSSIDVETEKIIQELIRTEFKDKTVIAIAHRLDSILASDMIAVMEAGELVEFAPPRELLARDSKFKQLYESQNSTSS